MNGLCELIEMFLLLLQILQERRIYKMNIIYADYNMNASTQAGMPVLNTVLSTEDSTFVSIP